MEREDGFYWVRLSSMEPDPVVARWQYGDWWLGGYYALPDVTVLSPRLTLPSPAPPEPNATTDPIPEAQNARTSSA